MEIYLKKSYTNGLMHYVLNVLGIRLCNNLQGVCQKLKLLTFSRNWEIRVVFTENRRQVGDKKKFLGTNCRTLENAILGWSYFRV